MKTVHISAYGRDCFSVALQHDETTVFEHDGYWLDGSKYLELVVDYDTGKILNWAKHRELLDIVNWKPSKSK